MAQCFKCGKKGLTLAVWQCANCRKNVCAQCYRTLPTINADFYNTMKNERFSFLTQKRNEQKYQQWVRSPSSSTLNIPLFFCSDICRETYIKNHQAQNLEFIRDQSETIIPTYTYLNPKSPATSQIIRTYIIRDALEPALQKVFDEVRDVTFKFNVSISERDGRIVLAKQYEQAHRFEDAAKIYDGLKLWEEAGRVRKKLKQQTTLSVDVNHLIEQLKKGGVTTNFRCPNCGASIFIDGKTDPQGLKFCSFCGSTIKTQDLVAFLQKIL